MADGDVWHRPITNKRHIDKTTGKLKHAALKKKIESPDHPKSLWKSEISGRLRSIVTSIENVRQHAEKLAAQQRQGGQGTKDFIFVGVAYTRASCIRNWKIDSCNIHYDPRLNLKKNDFDLAHANLTFATKPPDQILSVLDDVINELAVTPAADLPTLPNARCAAPWTYKWLSWFFGKA